MVGMKAGGGREGPEKVYGLRVMGRGSWVEGDLWQARWKCFERSGSRGDFPTGI